MTVTAAARGALQIGVLGPVEVSVDGRPVAMTARLRRVLVALAMSPGKPVSLARLASLVWGNDLPKDARRTVHVYVSRLRRLLGAASIGTTPTGYVLRVESDRVDAVRFGRLLREAALAVDAAAERALLVEALALWRGEPFEDAVSPWAEEVEATHLVDRRLTALERRIELDLTMDQLGDVVAELQRLTVRYPLREKLWGLLMTALHLTGRQADALAAYQRLYRLLGEELGVEPGAAVREVHLQILRGDLALGPPAGRRRMDPAPPQQLPAGTGFFTGRSGSLVQLDSLLPTANDASSTVVISAIAGAAGVGKTALAVHWARRVSDQFPDGQLYVNLRGFDPSSPPMRPGEALRGFLDALGVSRHRLPADDHAQVGLYRTLLATRRMLVLLDNARDADQVRPLLPGGAGCVVIVTSRRQLAGLVALDGAHPLNVDVLTVDEAIRFLRARLGQERIAAEQQAAADIAEGCGRLPLALTIVAARAIANPGFPLSALAGELRDARRRLDTLSGADDLTDMRAVLTWSYRTLTPDAARLFRLLGLHPGPHLSAAAAASLAAVPPERVRPLLTELASLHLLVEPVPGRYAFHDLLRAFAVDLAAAHEPVTERRAAVRRLLDHYLRATQAAASQLTPHQDHPVFPLELTPGGSPEAVTDRGPQLMSWLATEHAVLLASVGLAVDSGMDTHAWQLAWTLGGYLARSGHWQDWVTTQRVALAAAERFGNRCEQARAHRGLALAYRQLGRLDDAHSQLTQALRLSTELDDHVGRGYAYLALVQVFEMREDLPTALEQAQQALGLFERTEDRTGKALALNLAGWCRANLGDYRRALTDCIHALLLQQQLGDPYGQATTWDSLGYIYHHLADLPHAITCYRTSLALRRDGGERYGEARTLIRLGDTTFAMGDRPAATDAWQRAATILEQLDHPDVDLARRRLHQPSSTAS